MTKCCSFISFKIKKKVIIYIIAYWVCEITFRLFCYFNWDYYQLTENNADNEYLYIILGNLSDFLSFFELFYERIRQKCLRDKEKKEEKIFEIKAEKEEGEERLIEEDNRENKLEYENSINENQNEKLFQLLGILILDLLSHFFYYIYHSIFDLKKDDVSQKFTQDVMILINITMRFIFYILIIKRDVYSHHIFAIFSIFLIFLIIIILDTINIFTEEKYNLDDCVYYILILAPRSFIFPFVDTIAWKFMINKYVLPWKYLRLRGIFEFMFLVIITLVLSLFSVLHFSKDTFTTSNFWLISLFYIVLNFVKSASLIKVIYKYSSQAVAFLIISQQLSGSIYTIINFFIEKEKKSLTIISSIIEIILIFLIGIATMIYEEIIVIHLCDLDQNTKEGINLRGKVDNELASNRTSISYELVRSSVKELKD